MKRTYSLAAFLVLLLGGALPGKAVSVTTTSIDFAGACTDCSGTGTGTLVVSGFTPGSPLTLSLSNFVSFTYNGTNLLSPFTITAPSAVSGTLGPLFPGSYNVTIASGNLTFVTSTNGSWSISTETGTADFGASSNYTLPSVPEPATFGMMGAAVAGLFLLRRRRW